MNTKQRLTTFFTAAALSAGVVQATLLVVDDFESFTPGTLSGGGWTIGSGYGTSTAEIQSGGLDYTNGDLDFSGGNRSLILTISGYGSSDATVDFINKSFTPQTGGTDSTVYFRYTFRHTNPSDAFINIGMSGDSDADMSSRTSAAATVLRNPDQYRAWNASGTSTDVNVGGGIDKGNVNLIIGRVTFNGSGNETISFTLNPDSLTEGSNTWTTISTANLGVTSFDTFGVFANRQGNGTLELDNIAVADTWDTIAIPEPGTLALVGIALGSLLLFRRRR